MRLWLRAWLLLLLAGPGLAQQAAVGPHRLDGSGGAGVPGEGTVTSVTGSGGTTGLTLTGGAITSSGTLTLGGILIPANGGFGADVSSSTGIVLNTAGTFSFLSSSGSGNVARVTGPTITSLVPTFTDVTTGDWAAGQHGLVPKLGLSVAGGGTSLTTLTAHGAMMGNGTSAPLFIAPGTSGNVLTSNGTDWTSAAAAGGSSPTGTGAVTVTSGVQDAAALAYATAATASTLVERDSSGNVNVNAANVGYTTTATAAGTTTLTVGSTQIQYFTGSITQTVTLPVTSTLQLGRQFLVVNNSTGLVTINSSGGNLVTTLGSSTRTTLVCILTSGTAAASWSASSGNVPGSLVAGLASDNQITLSGGSSSEVRITASGSDTDVDITLVTQGAGAVYTGANGFHATSGGDFFGAAASLGGVWVTAQNAPAVSLIFAANTKTDSTPTATFGSKFMHLAVGANVTSASTIAPTAGIFHVTGTTQITTISLPYTGFTGCVRMIPDAAGSTATGGNIALGSTFVVSKIIDECFDGVAWFPSY